MESWTEKEIEALKSVSSMEEIAEVAISVLHKMKEVNGHKIIQICGPMSTGGLGDLEANMNRFKQAINIAQENGLIVFDQIPFQSAIIRLTRFREGAEYHTDILEILYRKIFESGYISKALFLPDWQSSIGASWEREFIAKLGIPIEEYPTEWLDNSS